MDISLLQYQIASTIYVALGKPQYISDETWHRMARSLAGDIVNEIILPKFSEDELHKFFWRMICNSCDCDNYPECPDGTDGCFAQTLAQELRKWINKPHPANFPKVSPKR